MERFKITKKVGIYGILGNLFLLLLKSGIAFICKSQSMIADAANSATDIFASLMTFIGNKIASEPQDDDHNFGHGKAEYIFSLFISISMILLAFKLLYDCAISLLNKSTFEFSWILIIVCIITIITKFTLYIYVKRAEKKCDNILVTANKKDHRNDCIITSFTLISILLGKAGIFWLDSIVGIGISIWICYIGFTIFLESYNVLMDISIDEKTKNTINELILCHKDIKNFDNFSSIPIGNQYVIYLTIYVNGNISTFLSHELADTLENEITKIDKVYKTIIHVNPI